MEEFYTVAQTALTLKVHPLTVRRYIVEGKLKAHRIGGNVRIALNELRAFVQTFTPYAKQSEIQPTTQTKPFSFSDPFLSLRGKGLNISKLRQI